MDLFKYNVVGIFADAVPIIGYTEVKWVERYRGASEFEIKAPLSSGLKELLPLDSFVSHVNTLEVMMVENISISESNDADSETEIVISGRGAEAFLENRIIGQNQNWLSPPTTMPVIQRLSSNLSQLIIYLINDATFYSTSIKDGSDVLSNYSGVIVDYTDTGVTRTTTLKRGTIYDRIHELMKVEDLGLQPVRYHGLYDNRTLRFRLHKGLNKASSVKFSSQGGDVSEAEYLWSRKFMKNAALVSGKFVETMVVGNAESWDKRVMFIDASDIDQSYEYTPTGTNLTNVRAEMQLRGQQALAAQIDVVLSNVVVNNTSSYRYRTDYNIGDIVTLDTNYGETLTMRVTEYAEIEDDQGSRGYPNLTLYIP